jgi:Molecular chaperone, HSP90 family
MAKVEFPKPLKQLLEESDLEAPLRALADRVGEILADNKLPFFPDYTDHGTDHINRVLKSEIELVPKQVWKNSGKDSDPRLLYDADAAVIIGGTLLHDIAMHLRAGGFLELVSENSRFQPLPWFSESHEGQSADRPWQGLWEDFIREARRFSERALTNIIGEESARIWKFHELPADTGQWERNHCLIVGEFIRRHHARLAHEIAIYGFPGIPVGSGEGQFPALGKEEGHPLMRLADLIGLTARSHGMSLRVCKSYLESSPLYPGTPRPMGTAVLYPMALLRVADYLQIDRQRAPAVLLQLRNPQSPVSIQEWKKHRAVQNIGPATNPRGKMVTVSTDLSLALYLQLEDLLAGLQEEMDHSTAVLDETYGTLTELGLNQLNLAARRVYSNLHSPAFRDSLPYVPNQTGFTSDPNLLTLLVEPLYGKEPSVGVRELMQNAVDAVCELEAWSAARGISVESLDLPEQDGDVLIEFIKREDASWFLRVRDRGIGMTSETIENYFLRAGASFRRSPEWAKEFLDGQGQPRVIRAGRFGIGVFGVFLLGPSFRLWTRHADADKSQGYTIKASANSQLIEIHRLNALPIGTTVEVELSNDAVKSLALDRDGYSEYQRPERKIDWFCWNWPKVVNRVIRGEELEVLPQQFSAPIRKGTLPPEWSVFHPDGFDAVYWTFENSPTLACNGLRIEDPREGTFHFDDDDFNWPSETQLNAPNIAVLDSASNLRLTIQRYALSNKDLPFIGDLARETTLSFIAHALVCGPASRAEALAFDSGHPLRDDQTSSFHSNAPFSSGSLRWCATSVELVPADAWLYSLLNTQSCFVYGIVSVKSYTPPPIALAMPSLISQVRSAALSWHGSILASSDNSTQKLINIATQSLSQLVNKGVPALGHKLEGSRVVFSASVAPNFLDRSRKFYRENRRSGFEEWRAIKGSHSGRFHFEAKAGNLSSGTSRDILRDIENDWLERHNDPTYTRFPREDAFLYAAEIKTKQVECSPASLISTIWNECLGARAIPFDPKARAQMIADGCKHPELKRHIKAWQEMKRDGSKWAAREY